MSKTILFTAVAQGKSRLLFWIEERASGDLTIKVKHSKFATVDAGSMINEEDAVVEERFSVHRSPKSEEGNNVIKYTRVLKGGRRETNLHFTKAIKRNGLFAHVFIHRAGNLLDERYVIDSRYADQISIGEFDPPYFRPAFMVLVGDKEFKPSSDFGVNFIQTRFSHFTVVLLWQFVMLDSETASQSLIPKTFRQQEIEMASPDEQDFMTKMAAGFEADEAIALFTELKHRFVSSYLSERWRTLSDSDKVKYWPQQQAMLIADLYSWQGKAFTEEHRNLLFRMIRFTRWFETSGAPTTEYEEEAADQPNGKSGS